jgi:hypothetical protein
LIDLKKLKHTRAIVVVTAIFTAAGAISHFLGALDGIEKFFDRRFSRKIPPAVETAPLSWDDFLQKVCHSNEKGYPAYNRDSTVKGLLYKRVIWTIKVAYVGPDGKGGLQVTAYHDTSTAALGVGFLQGDRAIFIFPKTAVAPIDGVNAEDTVDISGVVRSIQLPDRRSTAPFARDCEVRLGDSSIIRVVERR